MQISISKNKSMQSLHMIRLKLNELDQNIGYLVNPESYPRKRSKKTNWNASSENLPSKFVFQLLKTKLQQIYPWYNYRLICYPTSRVDLGDICGCDTWNRCIEIIVKTLSQKANLTISLRKSSEGSRLGTCTVQWLVLGNRLAKSFLESMMLQGAIKI